MFNTFFNWLGDRVNEILIMLLNLLPDSPFYKINLPVPVVQIMGYVNFFIPLNLMLGLFQAWIVAVAIYYALTAIMRWAKAIQ